jgi:hypothetical protein
MLLSSDGSIFLIFSLYPFAMIHRCDFHASKIQVDFAAYASRQLYDSIEVDICIYVHRDSSTVRVLIATLLSSRNRTQDRCKVAL